MAKETDFMEDILTISADDEGDFGIFSSPELVPMTPSVHPNDEKITVTASNHDKEGNNVVSGIELRDVKFEIFASDADELIAFEYEVIESGEVQTTAEVGVADDGSNNVDYDEDMDSEVSGVRCGVTEEDLQHEPDYYPPVEYGRPAVEEEPGREEENYSQTCNNQDKNHEESSILPMNVSPRSNTDDSHLCSDENTHHPPTPTQERSMSARSMTTRPYNHKREHFYVKNKKYRRKTPKRGTSAGLSTLTTTSESILNKPSTSTASNEKEVEKCGGGGASSHSDIDDDAANDKEVYVVERVIDKQVVDGQDLYLIKWKGYSSSCNTWEPIENLYGCLELVEMFERKFAKQEKPKGLSNAKPSSKQPSSNVKSYRIHPKWPARRVPLSVEGIINVDNELTYVVKSDLKNRTRRNDTVLVYASSFRKEYPQLVIQFYQSRLFWSMNPQSQEEEVFIQAQIQLLGLNTRTNSDSTSSEGEDDDSEQT